LKKSIGELYRYEAAVSSDGDVSKTAVKVCDLRGIFVPVSSELASKKAGFNENMSWKFFCRKGNPYLVSGNLIRYKNEDFHIVNVSDMGRIKIVKLNRIIGTKSVRNVVSVLNY
jgi:hypothetical protein